MAFVIPPEGVSTDFQLASAIAEEFGVSATAVRMAIATGRLPALRLRGAGTRIVYAVRPCDAEKVWGRKKKVA